jgi:hypothetical protein
VAGWLIPKTGQLVGRSLVSMQKTAAVAALAAAVLVAASGCGASSPNAGSDAPNNWASPGDMTYCAVESNSPSLSVEQRKADADARWMTANRIYSRQALIAAMSGKGGRGWTRPEAIRAADLLCLDWSDQAAKRGREVLVIWMKNDITASEAKAERLLLKEGFTTSEAEYGAAAGYDSLRLCDASDCPPPHGLS